MPCHRLRSHRRLVLPRERLETPRSLLPSPNRTQCGTAWPWVFMGPSPGNIHVMLTLYTHRESAWHILLNTLESGAQMTVLAISTRRVCALYTNGSITRHVIVLTNSRSSPVSHTSYSSMTASTMRSVAVAAASEHHLSFQHHNRNLQASFTELFLRDQ